MATNSTRLTKPPTTDQDGVKWVLIIFATPFIIIGVGIMAYGIYQVINSLRFTSRCSIETTGMISDFKVHGNSSTVLRSSSRMPVVVFTTADGKDIRFTSKIVGYEPVGTAVSVRYNPAKPQEAERTKVISSLSTPPAVLTMFGLFFSSIILWSLKKNLTK